MSETTRLFTALLLSALAIFLYNIAYVQPKLEKAKKLKESSIQEINTDKQITPDIQETLKINTESKTKFLDATKLVTRDKILKADFEKNKRVKLNSKKLHGSVNLQGALIDDLTLAEYKKDLDKNSPEVVLLSPKNTEELYFFRTGFVSGTENFDTPNENTLWKKVKSKNDALVLKYKSSQGLIFKKIITIDDNYLINIKEIVENTSNQNVELLPFGLVNRARKKEKEFYISHEGGISVTNEILDEVTYDDLAKETKKSYNKVSGWVGFTDKYWLTTILPDNLNKSKFDINFNFYEKNGQSRYQADILGGSYDVPSGAKLEYNFKLYAGAKKLNLLDKYSKQYSIPLFDRAIDFGALYFLTKPIFKALTYFHAHIGNFGLAILLLTICIRLLLFPLANKSYTSMAKMKKHMPEIEKLKAKYKNDKQKLSGEMMKYYKEQKINPMSGCLPMLVQIPVFFALYKVLYVTIEMRHSPFYGWIVDLSAKDPTNLFNLFGLLNYTPPSFLPALGVLPILFSLSMFVQQKLSPPAGDETQKMVLGFMPWILLFVFSNFPAGLVLYWVWNNILSISQQYIITKRIERDKNA